MGRETRAAWAARVARWTSSGLSAAAFAAREHVNRRTLTYWRWRLRAAWAGTLPGPPRPVRFVEVVVPPAGRDAPSKLEIVVPSGYRVRVGAVMVADTLRTVLDVLEGARMIPAHVRIFLCTEPVDLRRAFDELTLAARERLGEDPRRRTVCLRESPHEPVQGGLVRSHRVLACSTSGSTTRAFVFRPPGTPRVRIDGAALARLLDGVPTPPRAPRMTCM
jgi:transposase